MTTAEQRVHREAARESRRYLMSGLHVAEAGDEKQLTIITMNTSQFSLANRKQLADMLDDRYDGLRRKAKQRLRERSQALRQSFILDLAQKNGAYKVVRQIEIAEAKLQELKDELAQLGFEDRYDGLRFTEEGSRRLAKTVDKRVEEQLGIESHIDARFDSAQLAMMTVASLEDAEKLLKSVSEI